MIVERLARPTAERPRAPVVALGVFPAIVYFAIAIGALSVDGVAGMTSPWVPVEPLGDAQFASCGAARSSTAASGIRRSATRARSRGTRSSSRACAWDEVVRLAEALARETLAAEAEIVRRPELHARLGLPRAVRRALRRAASDGAARRRGAADPVRFPFHRPRAGGFPRRTATCPADSTRRRDFRRVLAPHYPWAAPVGDPAADYAEALAARAGTRRHGRPRARDGLQRRPADDDVRRAAARGRRD